MANHGIRVPERLVEVADDHASLAASGRSYSMVEYTARDADANIEPTAMGPSRAFSGCRYCAGGGPAGLESDVQSVGDG